MLYKFHDTEFGTMVIATRRGQRTVRFIWHNGLLHMSIPPGVAVDSVRQLIDASRAQIRALPANTVSFHFGQTIPCFGGSITLAEHDKNIGHITSRRTADGVVICFPKGFDIANPAYCHSVSRIISATMERGLEERVFPLAWALARELGLSPLEFMVGRGLRKLGHCTASGSIQLSRNIMFLPEDLIRLIICHELAHLTHHNHSKDFHYLCNSYLGGREKELERKLKLFQWPIIR